MNLQKNFIRHLFQFIARIQRIKMPFYIITLDNYEITRKFDKRYVSNWRPISLLNLDQKIISRALAIKS